MSKAMRSLRPHIVQVMAAHQGRVLTTGEIYQMVAAPGVAGFDPGDKRDRNLVNRELSDRAAAPRGTANPPPSWNPAPASLDLAWGHGHARNLELCAAPWGAGVWWLFPEGDWCRTSVAGPEGIAGDPQHMPGHLARLARATIEMRPGLPGQAVSIGLGVPVDIAALVLGGVHVAGRLEAHRRQQMFR